MTNRLACAGDLAFDTNIGACNHAGLVFCVDPVCDPTFSPSYRYVFTHNMWQDDVADMLLIMLCLVIITLTLTLLPLFMQPDVQSNLQSFRKSDM